MPRRVVLTEHARERLAERLIPFEALDAVLTWGERSASHGDTLWRLDPVGVRRAWAAGQDVVAFMGVCMVVTPDARVRTVWREVVGLLEISSSEKESS